MWSYGHSFYALGYNPILYLFCCSNFHVLDIRAALVWLLHYFNIICNIFIIFATYVFISSNYIVSP